MLVLPYHNPVELAKYAASLDQMSGGRVILGVGAGAMTEEFEALGVPFRQRGALTNECMAIMKELWTSPDPQLPEPALEPVRLQVRAQARAAARDPAVGGGLEPGRIAPRRHDG